MRESMNVVEIKSSPMQSITPKPAKEIKVSENVEEAELEIIKKTPMTGLRSVRKSASVVEDMSTHMQSLLKTPKPEKASMKDE